MVRMSTGSSRAVRVFTQPSSSRDCAAAARCSMVSSRPLASPLAIKWITSGGNSLALPSERDKLAPSRTWRTASSTAARIGKLLITGTADCKAFSRGTPLAVRIPRVSAKRAAFTPRANRPTTGMRRMKWCQRILICLLRKAIRAPTTPAKIPAIQNHTLARIKLLTAISTWVAHGNVCPVLANTRVTCGTT